MGAAVLGSIIKFLPEVQAALEIERTPVDFEFPNSPELDSSDVQAVLSVVKATKEYAKLKHSLASEKPVDYWADSGSGVRFISFAVQEISKVDPASRRKSPVYLLQTAIFAVDPNRQVLDVFLAKPDAKGLTSMLQSLRHGMAKTIKYSGGVQAKIRELYRISNEAKEHAKATVLESESSPSPSGCGPECDCGANKMYVCGHQTCGGGYVDQGCYWGCSVLCVFPGNPWARAACLVACRIACYVPRYCYCDTYRCIRCAC